MNAKKIDQIARFAVEKARANAGRDQRYYAVEEMVKQEMNAAGFAWSGCLDGSDRSIRAVASSLKRDDKAGRIHAIHADIISG